MSKVRISAKRKYFLKYQTEVKLKNEIIDLRNSIEGFNIRPCYVEGRSRKFKDTAMEFIQPEK